MNDMFLGMLFAAATGLLWTVIGISYGTAARKGLDIVRFQMINVGTVALISWALCDWNAVGAGTAIAGRPLVPVMLAVGATNGIAMLLLIFAMRHGRQAATWTIAQSAMIIPFFAGLLCWRETAAVPHFLGVGLALTGITLFGRRRGDEGAGTANARWLMLALLAFTVSGLSQTLATIPSHWAGWADSAHLRVPLVTTAGVIVLLGISRFTRYTGTGNEWKLALPTAVISMLGQYALFAAMDHMSRVGKVGLVYPFCIGISILGIGLHGRLVLHERLGRIGVIAMASVAIGLALMGI